MLGNDKEPMLSYAPRYVIPHFIITYTVEGRFPAEKSLGFDVDVGSSLH